MQRLHLLGLVLALAFLHNSSSTMIDPCEPIVPAQRVGAKAELLELAGQSQGQDRTRGAAAGLQQTRCPQCTQGDRFPIGLAIIPGGVAEDLILNLAASTTGAGLCDKALQDALVRHL